MSKFKHIKMQCTEEYKMYPQGPTYHILLPFKP